MLPSNKNHATVTHILSLTVPFYTDEDCKWDKNSIKFVAYTPLVLSFASLVALVFLVDLIPSAFLAAGPAEDLYELP